VVCYFPEPFDFQFELYNVSCSLWSDCHAISCDGHYGVLVSFMSIEHRVVYGRSFEPQFSDEHSTYLEIPPSTSLLEPVVPVLSTVLTPSPLPQILTHSSAASCISIPSMEHLGRCFWCLHARFPSLSLRHWPAQLEQLASLLRPKKSHCSSCLWLVYALQQQCGHSSFKFFHLDLVWSLAPCHRVCYTDLWT